MEWRQVVICSFTFWLLLIAVLSSIIFLHRDRVSAKSTAAWQAGPRGESHILGKAVHCSPQLCFKSTCLSALALEHVCLQQISMYIYTAHVPACMGIHSIYSESGLLPLWDSLPFMNLPNKICIALHRVTNCWLSPHAVFPTDSFGRKSSS